MSVKNAALSCHKRSGYLSIPEKKKKKLVWVQNKQHCQTLLPRTASVFNYSKREVKSVMERSGNLF